MSFLPKADVEDFELHRKTQILEPILNRCRLSARAVKPGDQWFVDRGHISEDQPLDVEAVHRHLIGHTRYGCYLTEPNTTLTRLAAVDFDNHAKDVAYVATVDAKARELQAALNARGIKLLLFRSGGGFGVNGWAVWEQPQRIADVRAAIRSALSSCGLKVGTKGVASKQVEVFPKNDAVGAYGTQVSLPFWHSGGLLDGERTWVQSDPVPEYVAAQREQPAMDSQLDLDTARSALEVLQPDDYDEWVRVGMALHSGSHGSPEAFEVWDAWSQRSDKYKSGTCEAKWATFNPTGGVGIGTLYSLAREQGWEPPNAPPTPQVYTLEQMHEQFAFIEKGASIVHLASMRSYNEREFHLATASSAIVDQGTTRSGGSRTPLSRIWLNSRDRITGYTLGFDPGRGRYFEEEGTSRVNLWVPPSFQAPENWQELAQPFAAHLDYLIPSTLERNDLLDWLAHMIQVPGIRPHHHFLLVAQRVGTGRGWVSEIFKRMLGVYATEVEDLFKLLLSNFNNELSRKLFVNIPEIKAPDNNSRFKFREPLKVLLSAQRRWINDKFANKHEQRDVSRFLLNSNDSAAIPLGENERRVYVAQCVREPNDPKYFQRIYQLHDQPAFIASVWKLLLSRNIGAFDPGRPAPLTAAKQDMIDAGRSEIQRRAIDGIELLREAKVECVFAADLHRFVSGLPISRSKLGGDYETAEAKTTRIKEVSSITHVLGEAKLSTADRKVKDTVGNVVKVWIVENPDRWCSASAADLSAECARARETFLRVSGVSAVSGGR